MSIALRIKCDRPDHDQIGGTCTAHNIYDTDTIEGAYRMAERAGWKITRPNAGRRAEHLCPRHNQTRIPPGAMNRSGWVPA